MLCIGHLPAPTCFDRQNRADSGGRVMTQDTIVRWTDPRKILVATNLVEGAAFMLHAIHQARLRRAKFLLFHFIPPFYLRKEAAHGTHYVHPTIVARNVKAKLDELAAKFQWEGIECEPIILNGLLEHQVALYV